MNCCEMLGAILAWEWSDPELMQEHFLTVASYNLQHPAQFTNEMLTRLGEVYVQRLDNQLPIAEIRRRMGQATAGSTRVRKPEAERQPTLRHWRMTIANVYLPNQPVGAAGRVRAWAAAIRRERG